MKTHETFIVHKPWFQVPIVAGTIERRILVNFRCRPDVLQIFLPRPFRPKFVHGWGIAGICLVRLGGIWPPFLPRMGGLRSENAAHRIAVEWDDDGVTREGVFIPRRDTNAVFNRLAGGILFPGVHHSATFRSKETRDRFEVEMRSNDGGQFVCVEARTTEALPDGSIFNSLAEASAFFQGGGTGWSVRKRKNTFDGLELNCHEWKMEPLAVDRVESSFFADQKLFPEGTVAFDSAFLMRDIVHEWHARGQLKEASI